MEDYFDILELSSPYFQVRYKAITEIEWNELLSDELRLTMPEDR